MRTNHHVINLLSPGKCWGNFLSVISFKLIIQNRNLSFLCEISPSWILPILDDDKSNLVQVMAWCRQTASHYLTQGSPYGIIRSPFVNPLIRLTPICVNEIVHICSRQWLVICLRPSPCLGECWRIVNWTLANKLQWNFNQTFCSRNGTGNVFKMFVILSKPNVLALICHI